MAAYNAGPFIGPAIESLLAQTFRDFELVVLDDGSTDQTPAILGEYARCEGRIKVLRNDRNRGLVYTRNRLLQAASAPFVAVADADDVCHPERLEKQLRFLEKHPECGMVGSGVDFLDQREGQLPSLAVHAEDRHIRFFMHLMPAFWNTTTCYRRELILEAGGYREGFDAGAEDYDLWARLLPRTRMANLAEPLAKVRLHGKSVTAENSNCLRNVLRISARLLSDYLGRPVEIGLREELHRFLNHMAMSATTCESAFALSRAIERKASVVEAPDTVAMFRAKLAEAAWKQAQYQVYAARSLSRAMAGLALRLRPTLWVRPELAKYCCRWLAPASLRRQFHRAFRGTGGDRGTVGTASGPPNTK
jgi:glycosyltransferase involved in cell wall biosynthesis